MPEWNAFKRQVQAIGGKHGNIKITTHEYEDTQLSRDKPVTINGEPIGGFPTLKITVTQNGKTKEIDYAGKRNAKELFWFITERAIHE
jgi:hypothetical protein